MRSPKTALLVIALVAVTLTAWAGNDGVANKPRSDKDTRTEVVQAQPANEEEKPDQATQSKPGEDQSPRSPDRDARAPESRSDAARDSRSEHSAEKAPEYKSDEAQVPTWSERRETRVVAEPTPVVRTGSNGKSSSRSSDAGEVNVPRSSGEPDRGRQRGGHGGYRDGGRRDPFDRRPTHYFGGHGWHGHHDHWRHRHFHGSWRFLFHLGPCIYYPPVHYPHVIRIPRDRAGVYVRYTGDDVVGLAFANSVREHLREQGLRVVYSQDNARLELYIISMEQDPDDPGYGSAISVSYVWYPGHRFITAQMVDAGLNQVDDLAASVAAYADDLVDDYR